VDIGDSSLKTHALAEKGGTILLGHLVRPTSDQVRTKTRAQQKCTEQREDDEHSEHYTEKSWWERWHGKLLSKASLGDGSSTDFGSLFLVLKSIAM